MVSHFLLCPVSARYCDVLWADRCREDLHYDRSHGILQAKGHHSTGPSGGILDWWFLDVMRCELIDRLCSAKRFGVEGECLKNTLT